MELIISEKEITNPTLCLNMIVKNESKIIERLFNSVLPIIDCYCICDTGSTDNTKELIHSYFERHNIPGKIVEEPFKDFAHNRNFALQSCINMSDYILLLDADMILEIKPDFNKSKLLTCDSMTILQGSDNFYYSNMRIVRNNGLYKYMGVTHEYVSSPSNNITIKLDKSLLFIRDIGDGGAKSDKGERDIRLLTKGIEDEPKNGRYYFYLANTYFDCRQYEKAIEIYKKRIELDGWEQEIWYSYYRIGIAYKNIGKMDTAIFNWLEAYNILPNRIENLYEIISHYRIIGKCKTAYGFYKMAKESLANALSEKDSYLFLNNDIYTYKLDYELSIIGCYIGIYNMNEPYIKIFNHCNDQYIIDNTLSNMKFYKDILSPIAKIDMNVSIHKEIAGKMRQFKSSSTSIIPYGKNGYVLNMRFVNYNIDKQGRYHDCDDHIITLNKRIELSNEFKIINEKLFDQHFENRRYLGLEDLKIHTLKKTNNESSISFIGTGLHKKGNIGIVYGNYDINNSILEPKELTCSFNKSDCEKNWVFVNSNNEDLIVYKWFPLELCKINIEKSQIDLVRSIDMPNIFSRVRGSTCGYEFKNELWFISHIVSYENPRHYYHIFSIFDTSMKLLRYSSPFKFEGEPIEYCVGIVVEDNRVIVPYSTNDSTTKLAIYDKKYIDLKVCFTR